MSEFAFVFHGAPPEGTPQQWQATLKKWGDWMKGLGDKGHLQDMGRQLAPSGKLVKDKKTSTDLHIDGTTIGGVMFIEARDVTHAVEISTGCPIFESGGFVEVRPVVPPRA